MTDNEIIKALECCISDGYTCVECPYADTKHMIGDEYELMPNGKTYDEFSCDEWLKLDLFALINRQKAEIERLTAYISRCKSGEEYWVKCLLERPNEAIKKFAERLKEKSSKTSWICGGELVATDYKISAETIDNLVKEMVGDDDA